MSATVRSIIIGVFGLILALYFGALLGQGSWLLPGALAGGIVLIGFYTLFFSAIRLEALILGFLLFGYIVGNRGFAQLTVTERAPLYLGELGMLTCLGLLGFRLALRREPLIPRSNLSFAIVVFIIIGAARLYCDIFLGLSSAPSSLIIRDSATVYYSLFFFIAYRVGSSRIGRNLLERCVLIACIVLLPVFVIQFIVAPELFSRITFRGYPLIAHKGDLTATYLAFASFYFFLTPGRGLGRVLLRILAMIFFLGIFIVTARAAIVGYGGAALLLLYARQSKFVLIQAVVALVGFVIIGVLHLDSGNQAVHTKLADKIESITDISGSHSYRGEVGDYSSANNQFRMVWWQNVVDETLRKGPIFGLGFGYDLSAAFLRTYYGNQMANWDVRSPHSIWVTVFGRMGSIGLLSFAFIVFCIVREAMLAARRVASKEAHVRTLAFWTGAIIILGSASFGVVLEGPMGGILFWSFVGLASSQAQPANRQDSVYSVDSEVKKEPALSAA